MKETTTATTQHVEGFSTTACVGGQAEQRWNQMRKSTCRSAQTSLSSRYYYWKKVGSDLFELNGFNYLIVVDYLPAFVEIAKLSSTTSPLIVNHMKSMFARHGIPEQVVTNNGPQYSPETFCAFATAYGFTQTSQAVQNICDVKHLQKLPYIISLDGSL